MGKDGLTRRDGKPGSRTLVNYYRRRNRVWHEREQQLHPVIRGLDLPYRIKARIRVTESCWLYQSTPNHHGYHSVTLNGKKWYTHRLLYTVVMGPIAKRHHLHHKCWNPACCNPMHLQQVTPLEHARLRSGLCKRGHDLNDGYIRPDTGTRQCRICRREYRLTDSYKKIRNQRRRERYARDSDYREKMKTHQQEMYNQRTGKRV